MSWSRESRHQRGYGRAHDRMRALLMRTVVLCEECARQGRTTLGIIADHIVPLAKGGTGERDNYQLLCKACSDAKTLTDKGLRDRRADGVDRSGRPTSADHPWNRARATPGSKV